jgi:hypothetical protein
MGGPACGHTRRAAIRLLAVCALAAPAALRSQTGRAIKGWCRRDPIVKIGDLTVDIILSSYSDMNEQATGPTQLVITVPPGMPTRFVAADPGFGRHGYDVRFVESRELIADDRSVDIQVGAYTPAANPPEGPLPILLKVTSFGDGRPASGGTEGLANEWVILHATLAADDFAAPPPSPADESDDTPPTDAQDKKARGKGKKGRGKKKSS